ncbi:MAG: hypothetical protein JWM60_2157 [Solirubrobacterales bacterium]|nr:hypothetical protein [Solirubrobacterales bacterium]
MPEPRPRPRRPAPTRIIAMVLLIACLCSAAGAAPATAAVKGAEPRSAARPQNPEQEGSSLEAAAAKAGSMGRAVAMSLIGLALAVAATVLAFRRDFKEAAAVFAVGIVAVVLATQTGVSVLRDTVASLFGSP